MNKKSSSDENAIIIDKQNPNFKNEIAKEHGSEHIRRCFACGTCSVICPVFAVEERYDPRKIIRMVILGMKDEVLNSDLIWLCSGCYSCYELCPRDVKLTNVMSVLRQMAIKEGIILDDAVRLKKEMPELKLTIPEIKKLIDKLGTRKVFGGAKSNE